MVKKQEELMLGMFMDYSLVFKEKLRRPRVQIARWQRTPIKLDTITFSPGPIGFYLTLVLGGVSVTITAVFCSEVQIHH